MTRLTTEDIYHITTSLNSYDLQLIAKTGHTLAQIASHATKVKEEDLVRLRVGIIPLTCGMGIIGRFSESVQSIVSHLGFDAFVTEAPDAGGLAEAVQRKAGVVMMADDDRFVAINLKTGLVSDNGEATGRGYAAGLDLMVGGLKGKEVLVVGAGPVGRGAAEALAGFGAKVSIYDIDPKRKEALVDYLLSRNITDAVAEGRLEPALYRHRIIIDACPAADYIDLEHLQGDSFIAAPGIPLGLTEEGLRACGERLLHDPLEIGVATMIYDVSRF